MDVELSLKIVEKVLALEQKHLTKVQEILLRQSLAGYSYIEIAKTSGYDAGYLKDAGSQLWQILSCALGEKVSKNNLTSILKRNYSRYSILEVVEAQSSYLPLLIPHRDWGEEIDISHFYGRTAELSLLEQWILGESPKGNTSASRCRVVAISGMGGIGKTVLSAKLVTQIQAEFDCIVWRSLQFAPFLSELLLDLISVLAQQQEPDLPEKSGDRISLLLSYLRQNRCLLILDNFETILASSNSFGSYREGYEDYGKLLERLGAETHQSCLILTSREKPKEIVTQEGEKLAVRSLQLGGLQVTEINAMYRAINSFWGTPEAWQELVRYYDGNPLCLKIVAATIHNLFDGSISQFLQNLQLENCILDGIRDLLDSQFNRLSDLEKEVLYWLAIEREPVAIAELRDDLLSVVSKQQLINVLNSLCRRCLIDKSGEKFTQKLVVMDYVTEKFTQQIYQEMSYEDREQGAGSSYQ
jgi:hypothetical protein